MRNVTADQTQLLERLIRRIDRKIAFEASILDDGIIELRLTSGKHKTNTRFGAAALESSADDVVQFEALRSKIKRVFDRSRMPGPPPKMPKAEIQKDLAYSFRPAGRGRR